MASVTYLPPPFALRSAQAAEAWEQSLPVSAQAALKKDMVAYVQRQPPAQRLRMARYLVANGIKVPEELNVVGLGRLGHVGQWGALLSAGISAAASAGAQIYTAKEAGKNTAAEASQQDQTAAQIAQINAAAAIAAANVTAGATVSAAQQAAGADVSISKTTNAAHVSEIPTIAKWGAVAVVGIAAVGFIIWKMRSSPKAAPAPAPTVPAAA